MNRNQIKKAITDLEQSIDTKQISARLISKLSAHVFAIPSEYQNMLNTQLQPIDASIDAREDFEIIKIRIERLIGCYEFLLEGSYVTNMEAVTIDEIAPTIMLNENDRSIITRLIEEMRHIINNSNLFDTPHKRRLLDRIHAIELETYKDKGRFDVFLGGLQDAGEALGKFGKDVKPLTDRMTEVAGIARERTKEYEQLPPPESQKRLPPPQD